MMSVPPSTQITDLALPMFHQAIRRGWLGCLWAWLTRHPRRLRELNEALSAAAVQNSSYAGAYPVEIKQIQGTEGKGADFDSHFNPTREESRSRWLEIAIHRLLGRALAPVELLEVDGIYYVRDGHHRISVAKSLGQQWIDAEVIRMTLDHRDF